MFEFILFLTSFFIVLASSYLLTSVLRVKSFLNSIIFLALISVSQLIISVEILSLVKLINKTGLLGVNFIILIVSWLIWSWNGRPKQDFEEIKNIKIKIWQALIRDKILLILSCGFIFSSLINLFLLVSAPTCLGDCLAYHLARVGVWIQNQTLIHYETTCVRQVIFPINSDILLLWPMIFTKKDYLAGFSQYFAYWGNLVVLFALLTHLKLSIRRVLWTLFIFASLPVVILQSSSTQNDLVLGFFLFSSLYLFIKQENKTLIFSAIALSIALGIKSSVFFFLPAIGLVYLLISIKNKGRYFYKPLLIYVSILIPAFIILSSFSYVLNYVNFGNPMGIQSYVQEHAQNSVTYKFFVANLIRYLFSFIDLTGFEVTHNLNFIFLFLKAALFSFFGIKEEYGVIGTELITINTLPSEMFALFGIIGFLVFLPLIFRYGLIRVLHSKNRTFIIGLTGLITVIFLLTISALLGYKVWNLRYLVTAIVLSSPIFALSYTRKRNLFKILICLIALFSYFKVSTCNYLRPIIPTQEGRSIFTSSKNELKCFFDNGAQFCPALSYIKLNAPDNTKIGIIFSEYDLYYPFFEENPTWRISQLNYQDLIRRKNFNAYDFLVISGKEQSIYEYNKEKMSIKSIDFSKIPDNFELVNLNYSQKKPAYYVYKKVHD
ncbi:MAG: hypothetical protein A2287_07855 [Candidatus Melainabacteria bacterium RIFOXYA12_FULL_32_12]|nr:MAG: hypothetical protein A2255_10475 [Candidatus Melainabacteria bacterium RIFOXYA2_FULL_32_9]OGI28254.1 MAG: hypothetical protein A2287_07855 [Candidatus Melainabacteria bacterium RIFOXYA12_FULL_32_12]